MSKSEHVYGIHAVTALLEHSYERVLQLHVLDNRKDEQLNHIQQLALSQGITVHRHERHQLNELVNGAHHQGVLAICRPMHMLNEADLDELLQSLTRPPLLLILDQVQDPHNLGACIRNANAAGVDALIIPKDKSVSLNATVRKVASGAAELTPVVQVTNLARTLKDLQQRGIWLYGMDMLADKTIYETDLKGAVGIVMGAEGQGLRRLTRETCDVLIKIPMRGEVESLNVSSATAVVLFECVRQIA